MALAHSLFPVCIFPLLHHPVYFVYQEGKSSMKTCWADTHVQLIIRFSTPGLQLLCFLGGVVQLRKAAWEDCISLHGLLWGFEENCVVTPILQAAPVTAFARSRWRAGAVVVLLVCHLWSPVQSVGMPSWMVAVLLVPTPVWHSYRTPLHTWAHSRINR